MVSRTLPVLHVPTVIASGEHVLQGTHGVDGEKDPKYPALQLHCTVSDWLLAAHWLTGTEFTGQVLQGVHCMPLP